MQLKEIHEQKRNAIETRLQEFRDAYLQSDEVIFEELCFCLMTPQTKAKSAAKVIDKLKEKNLLLTGSAGEIKKWMAPIRFNNNKSQYIVEARRLFSDEKGIRIKSKLDSLGDPIAMRSWLVSNVKGYGLKEASHFLRNIGFGNDVAILDRHILKHLVKNGVISEVPKSLTDKKYLEIEEKMKSFSESIDIPMAHLDLVWWSEETGEIFK
ncbi:MAG: N-glycosylase/DNA lyase [Candidatus Aenigmarchaeota archaeon]|nr:N-glycosylase/DNA lyase [Candidatus Aenigmarchaeota archaeon]